MVYSAADPWFIMWQIHGLQCGRSMVYNVADSWFTMGHIHGLQRGISMVYNAAYPWFITWQIYGLQSSRSMVLRHGRELKCGLGKVLKYDRQEAFTAVGQNKMYRKV
jgi:hypothetical protein